jgi:hypothetical protein
MALIGQSLPIFGLCNLEELSEESNHEAFFGVDYSALSLPCNLSPWWGERC